MAAQQTPRATISRMLAELFRLALEYHQAGLLLQAAELYAEVCLADPMNADARFLLGVIARQTRHFGAAARLVAEAIALCPAQARFQRERRMIASLERTARGHSSRVTAADTMGEAPASTCGPDLAAWWARPLPRPHPLRRRPMPESRRYNGVNAKLRFPSNMTVQIDSLQQFFTQRAKDAGLVVLDMQSGEAFDGQPTMLLHLGLTPETTLDRALTLELSGKFSFDRPELQEEMGRYFQEQAKRMRNPRPDTYVTLAGLPLAFSGFKWPFHFSTSGADTLIVHGTVRLEDGSGSPLHAKISASMTVTFAEIVPAPEQPFAESFIYNAIRKTLDQGQLEMLKSGNRQPVPVTTRYYSRWQNRFIFADTTEHSRADFVAMKVFWLSGVLGGNQPVWIADPRDAQYLNTTPEELKATARTQAAGGLIELADDFAVPTEALHERGQQFRTRMEEALALTKPEFNEEMRAGHTNM